VKISKMINGQMFLLNPEEDDKNPTRKIDEFALRPLFEPEPPRKKKKK
jgi:hypothetical protein